MLRVLPEEPMTHEEILKAARERLAEIDREVARLEEERAKLAGMLAQPIPRFVPVLPSPEPVTWPLFPEDSTMPGVYWTTLPFTVGGTSVRAPAWTWGLTPASTCLDTIVIGGPQRLPSDLRFA